MNNEIKEILDNFEKYEARYKLHNETQFIITHREIQILLDYITNLQQYYKDNVNRYEELIEKYSNLQQENEELKKKLDRRYYKNEYERIKQENERLKESVDWWKDRFFGQQEYDDSHRITAIEYKKRIDKAIEMLKEIHKILPGIYNQLLIEITQTLNILQGESKGE